MYTDLYTRQRRPLWYPVLGAIAIVSIAGAAFVYMTQYSPSTRASQTTRLEHEVANVTGKQASIYWQTEEAQPGWVLFGDTPEKLESLAVDDRDRGEARGKFKQHLITLKNVKPNTQYYYKIVSGSAIYTDIDERPFQLKTPNNLPPSSSKPVYGKVTYASGAPAEGVIVKVLVPDAVPMYILTKSTGEWLAPMQAVYAKNLSTTVRITPETKFTISIVDDNLLKSRVQAMMSKSSPLPQTIVLGTDYDFTKEKEDNVLPAFTSKTIEESQEVDIVFPKQGAVIPGSQPLLKGRGIPNTRVQLELNSQPIFRFTALVNERGDWIVNVPKPLQAGEYSLTLFAKNAVSEDVVINRSFVLAKDGEQVLAEATGPGTLSPTVEPTSAPSPTIAPTTALSPTTVASASPTIRLSPSPTQAATVSASLAPSYPVTPAPPVTGGNGIMYTIISIGLLVVGGGVMLLL